MKLSLSIIASILASHKPTVVFTPGAWHKPSCFDLVKKRLEPLGYPVVGITLPSVGAEPPNLNATDDALVLKDVLQQLTDRGADVVVVSHSYGGVVAGNALEGFGAKQRAAAGKKGGVIMNAYITSFAVPKGASLVDLLPNHEYLPWMRREGNYVYPDTPEEIFYGDLTPEAQQKAIADLSWQSAPVFESPSTYEPWNDIPSSYLVTDDDKAIVPPAQEGMVSLLGPDAYVEHVNSSHSPFLSHPDVVADFIRKSARLGAKLSKE
ncbi:alpha/beta hydrolase family protein [Sarocladium implicatum]|nr:alpha/beta hydrolase family protein [Sarocladium implicatum]